MLKDKTNLNIDYAGIHRALLAGLLGNIGYKTDSVEYVGARGTKFMVFPGSTLFKRKPPWIISAEIVETTRLYARTNARIDPDWIEQVAGHLVQRAYSEPHWDRQAGSVLAQEKVSLYGLPIIPRRTVHYGPVDPPVARHLFIQAALVEGDFDTPAPFFAHNQKLVDEIRALEAKTRSREFLVDPEVRYAFYDKRIPAGIFSRQTFEAWRRSAERHNPKLLFMTRRDLMKRSADEVTPEMFPDHLLVEGTRIPLEYHLDPGEAIDGVTAVVPLAALNQLPDEPFEWLVPGLLRQKVLELIRTLPKPLRVNFVPAPDFADKAVEALHFGEGSLCEGLAIVLGKFSGLPVRAQDFDPADVPQFLKFNFRIIDQQGRPIASGRDLPEIRNKLGIKARQTFASLPPDPRYHRDNITRWDFGDLPERIEIRRHGVTLGAYPALVDNAATVSLRLMDSPSTARVVHAAGVRRLFMIQLGPELRHLWRRIPNLDRMSMNYALLGTADELRSQIVTAAAGLAFAADGNIRTAEAFAQRAGSAWHSLSMQHQRISGIANETLALFFELSKSLAREVPPLLEPSVADMRSHLQRLVPRDFITATPPAWLEHLPRFLRGIQVRLTRLLNAGLVKDQQGLAQALPLEDAYRQRKKKHDADRIVDPHLQQYRWLLEEFRVSLFAQELKTSVPVSPKRLADQWLLVKS